MKISDDVAQIAKIINDGGVVAYPTEAVFGLGCRADDEGAIQRVLQIKQRSPDKGMLLIAHELSQLDAYIEPLSESQQLKIKSATIPTTWIVPALQTVSSLLTGQYKSLGIRIIQHQASKQLCQLLKQPLVSTSANISGQPPAYSLTDIGPELAGLIDAVFDAPTGGYEQPSRIIDITTNAVIR